MPPHFNPHPHNKPTVAVIRALADPLSVQSTSQTLTDDQLDVLARHRLLKPVLRQMVIDELTQGISLDHDEIALALQRFQQEQGIQTDQQLRVFAQHQFLTPEQLEHLLAEPLRLKRLVAEHYLPRAEARFLSRKSQLDRVVYSLLRVDDAGLAHELFLRIEAGEADFAECAVRYAQGPERATRGVVGPVALTQAHPSLAERLRTSQPGTLLDPFPLDSWWLVVRLESIASASFDEATAQQMARELLEEQVERLVTERLKALIALRFPQA